MVGEHGHYESNYITTYGLGRAGKAPRKMLEQTDKCADTVNHSSHLFRALFVTKTEV